MDTIEVRVQVDQEVDAQVSMWTLIATINEAPMTSRWNAIAKLLNEINATDELEENQKEVVKKFLKSKLELFDKATVS